MSGQQQHHPILVEFHGEAACLRCGVVLPLPETLNGGWYHVPEWEGRQRGRLCDERRLP